METIETLVDNFALFDEWEDRYRYLIDLGKNLPPLAPSEMTETYKVNGCTSQVWLVPSVKDGVLSFRGDSDAHIVKGLVYIVLAMYSGQKPEFIAANDIAPWFEKMGLAEHLTPNRRSGFFSMVGKIKEYARGV